jgi:hypothetical protein
MQHGYIHGDHALFLIENITTNMLPKMDVAVDTGVNSFLVCFSQWEMPFTWRVHV